jgi:raffinose/stachyose/melibiose transport system substrate-binding protein
MIALLVVIVMVVAGCGGAATPAPEQPAAEEPAAEQPAAEEPAAEEPAAEEPAAEEPAAEKVTVTWWHISTQEDQAAFLQSVADEFMAANPNVNIEITILENEAFKAKMTTVMQSGEPPDLFQSWGGGVMNEYVEAGMMKDITEDMKKDGWADSVAPGALGVYSYQGKNYGVPHDMGMVGMWYNKALFKEAGIDAPPTTWTELLDDVQKLKDAGITPITVGEGDKWPGHFWWVYLAVRIGGQEAFDAAASGSGSFADPPFVQAGEKLQELMALEPFPDGYLGLNYGEAAGIFGNKEAAMQLMGQWDPNVQKDNSADGVGVGEDLGWFPFPAVEGGAGAPTDALGGGNGWGVGKDAEPEAIEFLRHLTSPEVNCKQAEMGMSLPVTEGSGECVKDPLLKIVQEEAGKAEYFQLYYDQALPPAVGATVNDAVQELFAGTKTPEEVGQAIQDSYVQETQQ